MKRTRGFTLIELSVVVVILMLLAALVFPNLTGQAQARETRTFLAALPRIASQARETAISHGTTTKLTYDDAQRQLVLAEEKVDEDDTTVTSLSVPSGVEVQDFQDEGKTSNAADWELRFYSDGQCEGGGVGVNSGGRPWALVVDKYGIAKIQEGTLPDESQDRWQAGDYEHRQ